MTTSSVEAATVFGGLGVAVVLLIAAVAGVPVNSARRQATAPPRRRWSGGSGRRVAGALAVGLLVAVVTRWPVATVAATVLVAAWPWLLGSAATDRAATMRLEALATWTESLRDTIAGAVGLEQAIPATAGGAHRSIRPQLTRLCGRLDARKPLVAALRQFADDMDDASADLVVAALVLNAGLRGPGLHSTLSALATSTREELDMRRRVEAGRRGIRQGARIVVGVTAGVVATLAAFNRDYFAPYGTPVGQLVLAVVVAVFAAGFVWLRRLSMFDLPARILASVDASPGSEPASIGTGTWRQ
jgi:Flp pilus assembly protein TadB